MIRAGAHDNRILEVWGKHHTSTGPRLVGACRANSGHQDGPTGSGTRHESRGVLLMVDRRYSAMSRWKRQPEQRRRERRRQLLDSAFHLFATQSYARTSIEQICQGAHVGFKGFYDEFATKEALFLTLYEELVDG